MQEMVISEKYFSSQLYVGAALLQTKRTLLHYAASSGSLEVIKLLIANGHVVDVKDNVSRYMQT